MKNNHAINCDVAVVGAGPAGLAAAIGACEQGARDVVLLERDDHLGGILPQCIHSGFGLHLMGEDLTGPEYAQRFIDRLAGLPVRTLMGTMVVDLNGDRGMRAVSRSEGLMEIRPGATVLAMGCRERPRGAIAVPGSRPAGVMTAGQAQRFINIDGILPGRDVVILGSGDIGMIMARRLHLEGCTVRAVVEMNGCIGGLSRNLVQCIHDFKIPLYLSHTVVEIHGQKRVDGVSVAPIGADGRPDRSRAFSLDCDTLLLSVGLIPENELSRQAGIPLDAPTGGPTVDQLFQTALPGIFAAGNVVQVFDLVDHVSNCGQRAGAAAARFAAGGAAAPASAPVTAGAGIRSLVPQRVTANEDGIPFYIRARDQMRKARLQLLGERDEPLQEWRLAVVRPPEMITVSVEGRLLPPTGSYRFQLTGDAL
jgi:NADPH-dependent 2,4-dienoyl-CoA reductase/sulfur reductase-like enzyme